MHQVSLYLSWYMACHHCKHTSQQAKLDSPEGNSLSRVTEHSDMHSCIHELLSSYGGPHIIIICVC